MIHKRVIHENLFQKIILRNYPVIFSFTVFHDIENLKIAAKSMQVNILLIGEEYGKEDRDEIPARTEVSSDRREDSEREKSHRDSILPVSECQQYVGTFTSGKSSGKFRSTDEYRSNLFTDRSQTVKRKCKLV